MTSRCWTRVAQAPGGLTETYAKARQDPTETEEATLAAVASGKEAPKLSTLYSSLGKTSIPQDMQEPRARAVASKNELMGYTMGLKGQFQGRARRSDHAPTVRTSVLFNSEVPQDAKVRLPSYSRITCSAHTHAPLCLSRRRPWPTRVTSLKWTGVWVTKCPGSGFPRIGPQQPPCSWTSRRSGPCRWTSRCALSLLTWSGTSSIMSLLTPPTKRRCTRPTRG